MSDRGRSRRRRLGIVTSHVIQYHASLYRALTALPGLDVEVLFCSSRGAESYWDAGFGRPVRWDVPLLDGYRFTFLRNVSPRPNQATFFGLLNPGLLRRVRGFDAILVHGWMRASEWLAMLAGFAAGVPVVLRTETNLLAARGGVKARLRRRLLHALFRRVAAFAAIGQRNADFYEAFGVEPSRIFSSPYAVDNAFFTAQAKAADRAGARAALGVAPDVPVILYCGKLIGPKRPGDLLAAFAEVSLRQPCALVFVGEGALDADLRRQAAAAGVTNVHFAGFQNQSALPRFYAAADVFVLPSVHEPWGLVVNEAMCFGLPIVVSDRVGSAADLVRPGENGFVFPVGDVNALAKHLTFLLERGLERRRMGEASRRLIDGWTQQKAAAGIAAAVKAVAP